jgi:DNA-directed RNA polymerase specialized sigma24 family protein
MAMGGELSERREEGEDAEARHGRPRHEVLDDAELVAAMRRNDLRALREFGLRFRPLLVDQARRAGVAPDDRDERVTEFLCDFALHLVETHRLPRSLAAYLVTSFRNRVVSDHRARARRDAHDAHESDDVGAAGEQAVAGACSEYSLRAVHGPAAEGEAPLPPAVARLAAWLAGTLTDAERQLLTWVAHYVPTRLVAEWLGINHSAAKVRISRLRARLRAAAVRHAADLPDDERRELLRFFRHAPAFAGDAPTPGARSRTTQTRRRVAEEHEP